MLKIVIYSMTQTIKQIQRSKKEKVMIKKRMKKNTMILTMITITINLKIEVK